MTAGLVSALRNQGKPVIAVDLCPANLLRFHFGMNPDDPGGWARQVLSEQPVAQANYRNHPGIDFIPFGALSSEEYPQLLEWAGKHPHWLTQLAAQPDLSEDSYLVCHAPRTTHLFWHHASATAQHLELFSLDALTLTRMEQALLQMPWLRTDRTRWLLNGFDATRRLDRDAELVARQRYRERLLPVTLHRDEHHREALAQHTTIHAYAPSCQGAHDMTALALWFTQVTPLRASA